MTTVVSQPTFSERMGAVLTLGFGVAVAVWVAAFLAHLPWLNIPAHITGPAVLIVWIAAATWGARLLTRERGVVIRSAKAGLLTAALTLLIFGSMLVEQPAPDGAPLPGAQGLRPNAAVLVGGFLLLGVAIGAAAGLIASRLPARSQELAPTTTAAQWHARLAIVAAVSIVPLLIVGGKVTSAGAGMAIVGWPGSDGANMFLYPINLMSNPLRFLEHTHRLFGSLAGLCFLALLVYTFVARASRVLRLYATALFIGIAVQGLIGGIRVNDNSVKLAALHGVIAQLFFAGAVAYAARASGLFERGLTQASAPRTALRTLAIVAFVCVAIQLVFGAMYRHLLQPHALWSHVCFSIVVVALCSIVGGKLKRQGSAPDSHTRAAIAAPTLRRIGSGLTQVVGLQFALGFAALWAAMTSGDRRVPVGDEVLSAEPVPMLAMLIRTAHQANGALVIALTSLALVWTIWLFRSPPAPGSTNETGAAAA